MQTKSQWFQIDLTIIAWASHCIHFHLSWFIPSQGLQVKDYVETSSRYMAVFDATQAILMVFGSSCQFAHLIRLVLAIC